MQNHINILHNLHISINIIIFFTMNILPLKYKVYSLLYKSFFNIHYYNTQFCNLAQLFTVYNFYYQQFNHIYMNSNLYIYLYNNENHKLNPHLQGNLHIFINICFQDMCFNITHQELKLILKLNYLHFISFLQMDKVYYQLNLQNLIYTQHHLNILNKHIKHNVLVLNKDQYHSFLKMINLQKYYNKEHTNQDLIHYIQNHKTQIIFH